MKIYLASGNAHKLEEFRGMALAVVSPVSIDSAAPLGGMPEVEESAGSFLGNARIKADALLAQVPEDAWVLADDSGLEVDALGGAPGVYSSRFAGESATDRDNLEKLLRELQGISPAKRTARFRCVLVLKNAAGTEQVFEGTCEGRIIDEPRGEEGFGYDPVFQPEGQTETFGELGDAVKARLSHRARAFSALLRWASEQS